MTTKVTIVSTIDFKELGTAKLAAIESELSAALQDELAVIDARTQGGRDVDGGAFQAYAPEYAKLRQAKGRGTAVNLTDSGGMLQAMQSKVESSAGKLTGQIFFTNSSSASLLNRGSSASAPDKARWNDRTRHFFGLAQEQVARITERLRKAIHG